MFGAAHANCARMFEMTKRCFQLRCTDVLTITEITEAIKSSSANWQGYAEWLNFNNLCTFFEHLPHNFRLINSGQDGSDVQVQYFPLVKDVVCSQNMQFCLDRQPKSIVPRTQRTDKQLSTPTASFKAQVDSCAFLMFAFLELGSTDVSLLSLTTFLADADLPEYMKAVLCGAQKLREFMAMRPYLFFEINDTHFRMFDLSTAEFIVQLNNFIWEHSNRISIDMLPSIAEKLNGKESNKDKLTMLFENQSKLFSVTNGIVSAKARIDGFERACELLGRL